MRERFLEAGQIVNTHGVQGEVKIVPWCDTPEFLCGFRTLYIDGAPVEIGFNSKYLLDALRNADCDEVLVQMSGPLSPMKVLPREGNSFLFLVLPVRIRSDV